MANRSSRRVKFPPASKVVILHSRFIELYYKNTNMPEREADSEQPRKRLRLSSPEGVLKLDHTVTVDQLIAAQLEQEKKVGITLFAAPESAFSCVVKQRYTDFLVNEISLSGQVVHLEAPPAPAKKQEPKAEPKVEAPSVAAVEVPATNGSDNVKTDENHKIEAPPVAVVEDPSTNGSNNTKIEEEGPAQQPVQEPAAQNGAIDTMSGMHPSRMANLEAGDKDDQSIEQRKQAAIKSISAQDKSALESIFGEATTTSMIDLYAKIFARPNRKARDFGSIQSQEIDDKQKRTDAHVTVRRVFQGRIETVTSQDNTISIKGNAAPQRHERNSTKQGGPKVKGKVGWDELGGEHLHFTLYKENKDTMEVLTFLASQIKAHPKMFQMAGTKDRRGVTAQRVSAFRTTKERLAGFNSRLRQAVLGGFEYQQKGLELGELQGNEFTITLRDCKVPGTEGMDAGQKLELTKTTITKAMDLFQIRGFVNYYGLQRFGSFTTSTDEIGKRMLQGDFAGAVAGILTFSPLALSEALEPTENSKISSDDKARAQAINIWNTTQKVGAALDLLARRFQAENAVIRHLGWSDRKSGDQPRLHDYQTALMQITRNLRLMYVHAYQSLVWNTVAAKRWELFGGKVVEGDLVIVGEHKDTAGPSDAVQEDVDEDGEVIVRPAADDSAASASDKFERGRPLSADEAASGQYSIFDIVLPLPGFDVVYPSNELGGFYTSFMKSEAGGGLNPLDMRRKWKDISLSGGYRKVMARPANVEYEVKAYGGEDEQLVLTDLEKLNGRTLDDVNGVDGMEQDKERIALVLKMQLGSSQYATMALRELTKGGAVGYKPDFQGGR